MYIGPLLPVFNKGCFDPAQIEEDAKGAFDVQLTSNFHQMSQRGGGF